MERRIDVNSLAALWPFQNINATTFEKAFYAPGAEIILIWILFFIELPAVCMSLYGVYFMTRRDYVVPVFVINLLISDLMQICFKPIVYIIPLTAAFLTLICICKTGMIASIGFMVCIAFERYVMITYPVWYRLCHSFKYSLFISLLVWSLSIIQLGICIVIMRGGNVENASAVFLFFLLLPYPLVVFFFVGSWRALSRSISVSHEEQKRILRVLALVLFNYTVMFLPSMIFSTLFSVSRENGGKFFIGGLRIVSGILVYLNPLVDCLMYVFMRNDIQDILKSFCYVRPDRDMNETQNTAVDRLDAEHKE